MDREELLKAFQEDLKDAHYLTRNCGFKIEKETALQYIMYRRIAEKLDWIYKAIR